MAELQGHLTFYRKLNLVIWRPIPEPGYRCLGHIVSNNLRVPAYTSDNLAPGKGTLMKGRMLRVWIKDMQLSVLKEEYVARAATLETPILEDDFLIVKQVVPRAVCTEVGKGMRKRGCAAHKTASACYKRPSQLCSWGREPGTASPKADTCYRCGKRDPTIKTPEGLSANTFVARLKAGYHQRCEPLDQTTCENHMDCFWGYSPDDPDSDSSPESCWRREPDVFVIKQEHVKTFGKYISADGGKNGGLKDLEEK